MDSFTVAPELKGAKGDILAAKIELPILAVMIYGVVEFIRLGWSLDHYFFTYAPVLGGVAASVGLFTYFFVVSVARSVGFLWDFIFSTGFIGSLRSSGSTTKKQRWLVLPFVKVK